MHFVCFGLFARFWRLFFRLRIAQAIELGVAGMYHLVLGYIHRNLPAVSDM